MMAARGGRPLLLVDLAVPRDIDPACARARRRDAARHGRAAGAGARATCACAGPRRRGAEAIVEEEIQSFAGWLGRARGHADADRAARARRRVVDAAAGRERRPLGVAVASATRARRGAGARGRQAAAARADARGSRRSTPSTATRACSCCASCSGSRTPAAGGGGRGARGPRLRRREPRCGSGRAGSALALAQARAVARLLRGEVELVTITTAGDVDRARGDKSRWVGALEAALVAGEIDLAVHSAKDVPGELAPGTAIGPRRGGRRQQYELSRATAGTDDVLLAAAQPARPARHRQSSYRDSPPL